MAKKWRKRLVVAKIEDTYGQGSADMTGATLLEVKSLDGGNPYAGNTVTRERVRDGLGSFEQVNTSPFVERTLRVPLAGSGTAGEPPSFGILLRACGLSETIDTATVGSESVTYLPVSDNHESIELWWIEDGQLQHSPGVRGTFTITTDAQNLPHIEFSLTGLYKKTVNGGNASLATRGPQAKELPVNKQNTLASIDGHLARMSSFSLNVGNQVDHTDLVNHVSVDINNRDVTGSTNIEAPDIATKDYFAMVESHNGVTLVPLSLTHKDAAEHEVVIAGDQVQVSTISPTDNQSKIHYDLGLRFIPSAANDDDFSLVFRAAAAP